MDKRASRQAELAEAYKLTFGTDAGQEVLRDLMTRFHVLGATYEGDAHAMMHAEGERNAVLYILHSINTDPAKILEQYQKAQLEQEEYYGRS